MVATSLSVFSRGMKRRATRATSSRRSTRMMRYPCSSHDSQQSRSAPPMATHLEVSSQGLRSVTRLDPSQDATQASFARRMPNVRGTTV